MTAAWVNRNPDPKLHAFGKVMPGRSGTVLAMCRVVVREERGTFDPDNPKACEDCADYVRRGLDFAAARKESARKFIEAFADQLSSHEDHPWRQVGRCVYCSCGARLYQGTIPADHPVAPDRGPSTPRATRDMRERWGMEA